MPEADEDSHSTGTTGTTGTATTGTTGVLPQGGGGPVQGEDEGRPSLETGLRKSVSRAKSSAAAPRMDVYASTVLENVSHTQLDECFRNKSICMI